MLPLARAVGEADWGVDWQRISCVLGNAPLSHFVTAPLKEGSQCRTEPMSRAINARYRS